MTPREIALRLAAAGNYVVPVRVSGGDKRPVTKHGHLDASTDAGQWIWTGAEVGIYCRRSGFIAIDIDPRNGGDKTLADLEAKYGPLPRDCVQRTGSGGEHILLRDPSPGPDGWTRTGDTGGSIVGKFEGGIDVKCNGWIAVYDENLDPSKAPPVPERWIEALRKPEKDAATSVDVGVDAWAESTTSGKLTADDAEALRAELAALGPRGGGQSTTYKAVTAIFHYWGLSIEEGKPFLLWWNERNGDPFTDSQLARQLERVAATVAGRIESGELNTPRGIRRERRSLDEVLGQVGSVPTSTQPAETTKETEGTQEGDKPTALRADEIARRPRRPKIVYATFCQSLDSALGGGIRTRQVVTICAPPGVGKTGFAVSLALHVEPTAPVLHISTELDAAELLARYDAGATDRPWEAIDRGALELSDALNGKRIHLVGCDDLPSGADKALAMIVRQVRELASYYGTAPVVLVDYLQDLVRGGGDDKTRSAVGDVVKGLRQIAIAHDVAAVAISTVARGYYSGPGVERLREQTDARSFLAAAKESGSIEFDSAAVLFLDVEKPADGANHALARIAVAKARSGHPGRFAGARFYGASGKWEADPLALVALEPTARAEQKQKTKDATDKATIAAKVQELHAKGKHLAQTPLSKMFPGVIGQTRAAALIKQMVVEKALDERSEFADKAHKEVDLIYPAGAPQPKPPPADPDSTIARWVREVAR